MYIDGLFLKNYMGIGAPEQRMAPFKKFNFFIGANNAGKSTTLNFISKYLPIIAPSNYGENKQPDITPLEYHRGVTGGSIEFGLAKSVSHFLAAIRPRGNENQISHINPLLRHVVSELADGGFVWLKSSLPFASFKLEKELSVKYCETILSHQQWQQLWHGLTGQGGGGLQQHWIPETFRFLLEAQRFSIPRTILIPGIRQIGPSGQGVFGNDGTGLIDKLAELQSPDHDRLSDKETFHRINRFLQVVTDTDDARIEIPHNRAHVLVQMNGRVLPLASLGTGIHEVIMLASACIIHEEKIICIEEPEIHLHPVLQRKFMNFLNISTNNQYFIATHSPSFIDTKGAAIFHVSHDKSMTTIKESILRSDRYAICTDLGHRASDILQSNAVIWVEGPSERIYLRHWIENAAPDFVEGVHYSIMFYGGRLLSHLSADDSEIQAFIDLRYLNQNLAVVMDSDRQSASSPINSTKQRIINELANGHGVAWLTSGREIENYVDYELLQRGLSEIHPSLYNGPDRGGPYDHAFYFRMAEMRPQPGGGPTYLYKEADKVKLAKWVCSQLANLDVLDLRERITEIVRMIAKANG